MKRILLVALVVGALLCSACESDQKVKKGEVLVDHVKVSSMVQATLPVEIGLVEFGTTYDENLLGKAEWAFQNFLTVPKNEEEYMVSIAYQNAKQVELEWERLDDEWVAAIKEKYPAALDQGYYRVAKIDPARQVTISGKFEGNTQRILEISNPFWEEGLVDEPMDRKMMEEKARAYVVEKHLLGDVQPLLKAQFRYVVPEDQTEWFWFRYEAPDHPENQVLMVMRNDTTAFISFHSGYMAMVVQNETERFAEKIEIE
ncbi:hypothetical protein SANA_29260 [Gottschalkiaceae bacterium SANA]|nr:hypothetical protein SANA_29260 [Gottschalkiaceae bacterium SANA]